MGYLVRKADDFLRGWKQNPDRNPLIIKGAYVKIGLNQEKPYKTRG